MTNRQSLPIDGAFLISSFHSVDERGQFVKSFAADTASLFQPKEVFFSHNNLNVLRGMHFQSFPAASSKLVTCISGCVHDVIFDFRPSSHSVGRVFDILLDASKPVSLFVPAGVAHGFLSLSSNSTLLYVTSEFYNSKFDSGFHWSSIPFTWPFVKPPIISSRDSSLPPFDEFSTASLNELSKL